ncbi:MAG: hypothetical protein KatS3mg014_1858 [Actinomycetota bacterium]|nr:MAG: hypothetical protein KatS3mg014_1858 [Actinomycetota bacterium]
MTLLGIPHYGVAEREARFPGTPYTRSVPLFEFTCRDCGARFERLLPAASPDPACPTCGSAAVSRLLSAFAAPGITGGDGSGAACACGGTCACGRR